MPEKKHKRFVKEIDFKIEKGQTLVISLGLPKIGLERIIVENNDGIVEVRAEGRTRFEFSDEKTNEYACDLWLANPYTKLILVDYLIASFWSQFNWTELFKYQKDDELKKEVNKKIRALVADFEKKSAEELNSLLKKK